MVLITIVMGVYKPTNITGGGGHIVGLYQEMPKNTRKYQELQGDSIVLYCFWATIDDSLNGNRVIGQKLCGSSSTGIHNLMLALNSTIVLNKNMLPQHTCCLQTKPAMNANTICLDFFCYLLDISSILSG